MAREFEILNADINIKVNSKNAESQLNKVTEVMNKVKSASKLTIDEFVALSVEANKISSTVKGLNATLSENGVKFDLTARGAKTFGVNVSTSIEQASNAIVELRRRFSELESAPLNLDRGFKQTFTDIKDSIALVSSGGNFFVGLQQSLFGLEQQSGLIGKAFKFLTKNTDDLGVAQTRLQQAALRTTQRLTDIGLASQDAINIIKQTGKEEGLASREFNILTTQIQNVTNEYQRLERVIQTGGKPSAAELQRIRVEARGLETAFTNLTRQGIIPVGSETGEQLSSVIKSLGAGEIAVKQLTEIMKALEGEEKKVALAAIQSAQQIENAPKKGYFSWLNLFNIFKKAPTDINNVNASLNKANATIERTSGLTDGLKFTIAGLTGGIIGGGLVSAIPAVFSLLQDKFTGAIQAASDAAEEASKFETVFDSKVDPTMGATDTLVASVRDTLDEMAQEMGRSRYELRKFAAAFQDTFVPLGFGREEAAKLSISVTELTENLSSFYNMSEQQVSDRLSSFLVGNYENARAFGSIVTDARLDAELLKMGITGGTQAVDQQTKSLVALKLLYNDTSDAQGDVIRTANSFANQLRVLQGQARDAAVELGTKLLVVLNPLLTAFIRLKSEIGPSISAAFNSMFNAIAPLADAFNTIIAGGSIEDIFNSIVGIAQNGVLGVIETLDSLIPYAADWAYAWGTELYNGLLGVVDLVWDAVSQIAEAMADLLAPGSPPKEGPLSTIDTWGKGLMDTFSSGMDASSVTGTLEQQLSQVTANLLKTRQEIIDAEKAGYVPPELKERLALEEQQQQNLKDQISSQSKLGKEQQKSNQQANKKAGGVGGSGSPSADRKATEKKTAQEIYQENLRILDQQLKDGVIKYEDYAKERLKIEKDFNEETLKEGLSATSENISNIKKYQDEVAKIEQSQKKGKGEKPGKLGLEQLGLNVEDFLPKPANLQKSVSEAVSKIAVVAVDTFKEKVKESTASLGTTLLTAISDGFTRIKEFIRGLTPEQVFPFTIVAGFLAEPLIVGFMSLIGSVASAVGGLIAAVGGLGAILSVVLKTVLHFSVTGLIIYGLFVNWNTIVEDVTIAFGYFGGSLLNIYKRILEFVDAFKQVDGLKEVLDNFLGGLSLLALTVTNVFGLVQKVIKVALLGGIVVGIGGSINLINVFIERIITAFGGTKNLVQSFVDTLLILSNTFKSVANNTFLASDALFRGDFTTSLNLIKEIPTIISNAFSGKDNKAIIFFTTLRDAIIKAIPVEFQVKISDLIKQFQEFFNKSRLGGEVIRLITTVFNQLYQSIINNKEGWQLLATVVGAVVAIIANVLLSTLQALVDILPYIEGALTGVVQIFTGLVNIIGGVVNAFQAAFQLLIDVITGQNTDAAKQKLFDSFGSIATGLTDIFQGAYRLIINVVEGLFIGVLSLFSNFFNNIGTLVGGGFGQFTQALVTTKDQLIFIFSDLNTQLYAIIDGLVTNGQFILQSLFTFLVTEPKKAIDTVIQLFLGLYNELIGNSIIPDMITGIIDAITIFKTDFLGIISSLITGTLDFFLGIGKSIINSIITSIQENAGALLNIFSTLFGGSTAPDTSGTVDTSQAQQIIASAQQVFITLTNFTGTLQTSFNNFISSSLAYLSEVANNTLNTFILVRDTLIGENSLIEELATTIVSILSEMGVSINATLSYIQDSATQVFKIEKWSAIGRFIVSGIQTGMSEKRDSFLSYVRKLAKQAVDTAANELGIKSPSIKFRELGINSVEGFKQGLEALPPTTNNIAEQAMDGISSVFKSFNEVNRKVLKNVTVDIFKANQTELLALIKKGGKAAQIRLAELYGDNAAIVKSGLSTMDLAGKFIKSFVSSKEIMNQEFINTGTNFVQGILGQQQDIITAFNTTLENVRYQTNSTRNSIEDAFKKPLTDEFLNSLYASVKNGETFGVQLDSQIKIAYLSQQKLNASLVDQKKIEEQIRAIQATQINVDKITKPINDISETIDKEAGALDLLDSLKLGIDATAPDVLKKLSQLANDMVTKLNTTLKINSPSKVFMSIGENLGLGLVAGLDKANKLIPTTIQDISNNLTSALKNSTINQNGLALNTNVNGRQLATQPINVTVQNTIGNNMDLATVEQRILNTITKAIRR